MHRIMRTFLRYIVLPVLLVVSTLGYAQDQPVFNNYISTQGVLNPAYNGTRDIISGLMVFRTQWTGFEGAPLTGALNVHSPLSQFKKIKQPIGIGLVVIEDNIGFTNNLEVYAAGSYQLKLDRKHTLSLGLQLGFKNMVYDGSNAYLVDYGDPVFTGKVSKFGFNFGFGGYLLTKEYFAGLSIPRFFTNKYNSDKEEIKNTVSFNDLHIYVYGGYIFDINDIKLKPTGLLRIVPGAPLELDISCSTLLIEKLWLGLSYRTVSDIVFFAEYQIDKKWSVRYSFDYTINSISKYAKFGSHELGVQFDLSLKKRPGMRSIRYF